jgi:uncharacterized repeat protein (TIGR03803 family)
MKKVAFTKLASVLALFWAIVSVSSFAQGFKSLSFNGTDGANLGGALVQGMDGNFYGTTVNYGVNGSGGTVFKITRAGELTTIYNFCSLSNCADGKFPNAALLLASNGSFYGTTIDGGAHNAGTVFRITPTGMFSTIYSFCTPTDCSDGAAPSGLIQGTDGNFYGTAYSGGTASAGVVFKLTPAGTLTTLHSFCTGGFPCTDGFNPDAALAQGRDGSFYGTTVLGGDNGFDGVVFKISPTGNFSVLHSFCSLFGCADGATPYSALVQATDGNFYGTTYYGGTNCIDFGGSGCGTVFRITPTGTLTTIYNFCPADCSAGYLPIAGLIQGSDGNLFGTTDSVQGCLPGACGGVFKITLQGIVTTIHTFCTSTGCPDGANPQAPLLQATDGTFYGSTFFGGTSANSQCMGGGCGTLFTFSEGLPPFIEASPNFGKAGLMITILGNGLTRTTSVTFNGTQATFKIVSDTYIRATVPAGATTGIVEVRTPNRTLSSKVAFQVK